MISVEYRHEEQTDGRYEADDKTEALSLLANHLACMGTPRALDRRPAFLAIRGSAVMPTRLNAHLGFFMIPCNGEDS